MTPLRMAPVRVTPPAEAPVALADVKRHVNADSFVDDDDSLQGYLDAAVAYLDGAGGVLGRCLVSQDWEQGYSAWAPALRLPFPDVSAVAVTYFDAAGDEQTVDPGEYDLVNNAAAGFVLFRSGFAAPTLEDGQPFPVRVVLTAGFGAAAAVPAALKQAIRLMVAQWYDRRAEGGAGAPMPFGVPALIAPWRVGGF